jgi:hypothetical protein
MAKNNGSVNATGSVDMGIKLPKEIFTDVKPSEIGGWNPGHAVTPATPTFIRATKMSKSSKPGEKDYVLVFRVGGKVCKSFASTLLGTYDAKFPGESAEADPNAVDFSGFRSDLKIGYIANTGDSKERFPFQLAVDKK